jgi:serine/threonine protein kinase
MVANNNSQTESLHAKHCPVCAERYPSDFRVCPRDAATLEETLNQDEDPLIGAVFADSYEIVRAIGEGGMGRVYEARHKRLASKRFAIKVLHADMARQPDVVSRFLREAEATSVLSHANIVAVVDVNRAPDGRPYIVAELLEGEQLGDYLERVSKLSVPEAIRICRQICRALIVAHAHDIVHRDIKPENVFLVGNHPERTAKVLDFGISRHGEGSGNLTKTGMVMGTPAYMPPEQARGQRVDHRADIYAVGTILYEMVTGKRPFEGDDAMSTLASVLSDEPARPCTLDASLPPALEMVIQKAMAKNPAERFASMRELDDELAAFDDIAPLPRPSLAPTLTAAPKSLPYTVFGGVRGGDVRQPQRARASILVLSLLGAVCALGGLVDAATSAIRWIHATSVLSSTEIVLALLGSLCLLIAPGLAWSRFLVERVWPSTPRAMGVRSRLKRVLVASLITYGVASLAIRVLEGVIRADASGVDWPGWAVLSFAAAVVAGAGIWLVDRLRHNARVSYSSPR